MSLNSGFNQVFVVTKMMKTSKIAALMVFVIAIATIAPASAYFSSQNVETKAERMVEVADEALERVMDLVETVESDISIMDLITGAGLDGDFYGNVSLCVEAGTDVNGVPASADGEGFAYLKAAKEALLVAEDTEDYEAVINNAQEALAVFRDVLRSINDILVDAGVETDQPLDTQVIQEAIERSLDKIAQLQALLKDEELLGNLTDAEGLLTEAQNSLDAGEIDDAKDALIEANAIISYVCRELKQIAQELTPKRITGYLNEANQYRERFRERFGQGWNEEFDVDGFLQKYGYQSEEEFMNRYQEMLENAKGAEDIEEAIENLKELGQMIKNMDSAWTKDFGRFKGGQGQNMPGKGNGFGNMGGGNSS